MTILPLIERELAVRARRKGTYWSRFAVGFGGVVLCLQRLLMPDWMSGAVPAGKPLFNSLTVLAFVLCCTAGFATADSISAEAREGTLGLLLLTRVRRLDLILGKLAAHGLGLLVILATLLPLLMLPVLAGGVTGGEALRKGLVLLNTAFLCLAVGLNSSAFENETVKAVRRTVLWLVILVFGLALIPGPTIGLASPLRAVFMAGDSEYASSPATFWISLVLIQCLAWFFIWGAVKGVRQATREPEEKPAVADTSSRRRWHASISHRNPIEWAVARERGVKPLLWAGAALVIFNVLAFRMLLAWSGFGRLGAFWLLGSWVPQTLFGCLSAAMFAWASSRFLLESRKTGELELLLTTPLGAQTLIRDYWRVLRLILRWPLLAIVFAILLQYIFAASSRMGSSGGGLDWLLQYQLSCGFALLNAVASVFAIAGVGLWFGMKASTQTRAVVLSVVLAKGVPALIALCWSLVVLAAGVWMRGSANYYYLALLPQAGTLLFYIWLARAAKRGLLRDLSRPGEEEPSSLGFLAVIRRDLADALLKFRAWKVT